LFLTDRYFLLIYFLCSSFLYVSNIMRTDHGSLRWLLSLKNPEGQLARWLQVLSSYDMTIVHRPGRQHRNADALSRIPCRQCGLTLLEFPSILVFLLSQPIFWSVLNLYHIFVSHW
jgi:hypothetical protein